MGAWFLEAFLLVEWGPDRKTPICPASLNLEPRKTPLGRTLGAA